MLNSNRILRIHEDFVLQISYDDYTRKYGGVNKLIRNHVKSFNRMNISVITIFPLKLSKKSKKSSYWGMIVDATFFSCVSQKELIILIKYLEINRFNMLDCFIHHLYGINLYTLDQILSLFKTRINFYLHDNYSICVGFNLMKNDERFCGDSLLSEVKCGDCKYYKESYIQKKQLNELFNKHIKRLRIISPSIFTKQLWLMAYPFLEKKVLVVEHQSIDFVLKSKVIFKDKIRLAYVGVPENHKGWNVWKKLLTDSNVNLNDYEIYYFGISNEILPKQISIKVSGCNDENAMINALEKNKIDIVILWSLCPETFSYAYYEVCAANCFVLTNIDSGNIASQVSKRNNGIVFKNDLELYEFLNDQENIKKVLSLERPTFYNLSNNDELFNEYTLCKKNNFKTININTIYFLKLLYILKCKLRSKK